MKQSGSADLITLLSRGWQASFNFFEPKEMSSLVLVALNTTLRSLWPLFKYFSWWLLLWGCYIDLYVDGNALFGSLWEYTRPMWYAIGVAPRLYVLTMMMITFVMILCVRASLQAKRAMYFMGSAPRLLLFAPLFILVPQIFAVPIFWFMAFFFLDAPHSLKGWANSLYNGAILWLAYAPFIVIMGALHGVLFHIHRMIWDLTFIEEYHFFAYIFKFCTSMTIYLFFVAMLGAFYLRVVQGNSSNKLFLRTR